MTAAVNRIDLTGQRFGRLVVVEPAGTLDTRNYAKWRCKCDCGNEHVASGRDIRTGKTKSCGCLRKEAVSQRNSRISAKATREFLSDRLADALAEASCEMQDVVFERLVGRISAAIDSETEMGLFKKRIAEAKALRRWVK